MSFSGSSSQTPRTIIHVDLDAFYCSVEEQSDATLRGIPFAVGGRAEGRGVVASCSYAARRAGVRSAMPMALAKRLCPNLRVVETRHSHYRATSERVMQLLRTVTPRLEQISIDEAFLDVTELVGRETTQMGRDLALDVQRRVLGELGLSCSVGVASNKMVAKIATDCGKAVALLPSTATNPPTHPVSERPPGVGDSPHALWVVEAGDEARFLSPLPVSALWGVGPKMEERLQSLGMTTIGDIAAWSERDLAHRFGKIGADLARHARGIDRREVTTERESKSISSEETFVRDITEWEPLHEALREQAGRVAADLRQHHFTATTVRLKLRWADFSISTRQSTLLLPTDEAHVIEDAATTSLSALWQGGAPVRRLGVGVSGLHAERQLGLFDSAPDDAEAEIERAHDHGMSDVQIPLDTEVEKRKKRLGEALALLESRFGHSVVKRGVSL